MSAFAEVARFVLFLDDRGPQRRSVAKARRRPLLRAKRAQAPE
jgi:hypothetical protein